MRTGIAIVIAAGLVGVLGACSSAGPNASGCEVTPPGSVSDSVGATGDFGSKPTIDIDFPLTIESTERSVVIEGDGERAVDNSDVAVDFTILSGATGEEIEATPYDGESTTPFPLDGTLITGITKTLLCSTEGSRVVGVIAPGDGVAEEVLAQFGLGADDALVFVADVISVAEPVEVAPPLSRAEGEDQELPEGFPAIEVTLADDGEPTLVLPGGPAPTELQLAVLKKGEGAEVGTAADVIVHYVGMNWDTSEIFDASWSRGAPSPFNTSQVIQGFTAALEGQTVGSQVLVVIPPVLAYGEEGSGHALAGQTLVFIVDILGLG